MSAVAPAPVLDELSHRYVLEGKLLVSVSRVIDAVMRKSWEGVDPAVIENAAERGRRVEKWSTEMFRTGAVLPEGEDRADVLERLEAVESWYVQHAPVLIDAQRMVWSTQDEVAGMIDYVLKFRNQKRYIVDMKCTAQAEATWPIQLGGYSSLSEEKPDGVAVLHINPKFAKGYIWREYDPALVEGQWKAALRWYRVLQQLKAEAA